MIAEDQLRIEVPLYGDDAETQALGAVVYLLESCNFGRGLRPLTSQERAGITQYLADRYRVLVNFEKVGG